MKPFMILKALEGLNWQGHVELPIVDMHWLARELAAVLSPSDTIRCNVCQEHKSLTVETNLGRICEDCIEDLVDAADESRREMED